MAEQINQTRKQGLSDKGNVKRTRYSMKNTYADTQNKGPRAGYVAYGTSMVQDAKGRMITSTTYAPEAEYKKYQDAISADNRSAKAYRKRSSLLSQRRGKTTKAASPARDKKVALASLLTGSDSKQGIG